MAAGSPPPRNYGNPWIFCPAPNPAAKTRAFLFHHVGASATWFMPWQRMLDPSVEGLAVWLPGRGARVKEPSISSIPDLVKQIIEGIGPLLDEKPFVAFGHSYGCAVAYELARELRRQNRRQPSHLILSSRPAPLHVYANPNHKKTDEQLYDVLVQYGGTPKEILDSKEMMAMAYPILRADWKANETYVAEPTDPDAVLDIPFTVYHGNTDLVEVLADVDKWKQFTTKGATERVFAGGHFWMSDPENHKALIARFKEAADTAA
eukprot:TRINITY_DN18270_c0_g1_i1.p2 TRINITY_DN18270_c0_g1~~TRINITY_DN18270_c0_g1_i1.p2  ORF type:complete len:263 (-),score=52.08 TRINITY_DN18270_c0_g1_i1:172-960(-)